MDPLEKGSSQGLLLSLLEDVCLSTLSTPISSGDRCMRQEELVAVKVKGEMGARAGFGLFINKQIKYAPKKRDPKIRGLQSVDQWL